MRTLVIGLLCLTVGWGSVEVYAQRQVPTRRVGVSFQAGRPLLWFGVRDLVNANVRQRLASGLEQTMVTTVFAYGGRTRRPIASAQVECSITYDLWQQRYRVRHAVGGRDQDSSIYQYDKLSDVLDRCLGIRALPIGDFEDYRNRIGSSLYFAVLSEFNPVSRRTVERIRRLLARNRGVDDGQVFGSFVGIFVNKNIGAAERSLRFRSQQVTVP